MKPKFQKPPIVRRGQKKPFRKATAQEVENRVEATVIMLGQRKTRTQVHTAFREMKLDDGSKLNLDWRTVDVYISRAKKRMVEESGKPKDQHRLDSLNTYLAVIRDPRSSAANRIAAQREIDDLLGLKAPRQYHAEIGGPGGGPIPVEDKTPLPSLSKERLRELIALSATNDRAPALAGNGSNGSGGNGEAH